MHLKFRNVNDAFEFLVKGFHEATLPIERKPSRAGEVLQIVEPVLLTYEQPRERVLLNPIRDCNCFFTMYESLWMLAGRNDVAPLKYYSSKIGDVASDDGETFNGAYGYRWRHNFDKPPGSRTAGEFEGTDQLDILINHLKNKPDSRRAVLQMWNVQDDLTKIDSSKDVCCNLSVLFALRQGEQKTGPGIYQRENNSLPEMMKGGQGFTYYLDITVTNRSNDLVWGCLGANYVHFSFLQEYVADCLGVKVGLYHQFTNNLHVYTDANSKFEENAEKWLSFKPGVGRYTPPSCKHPLVTSKAQFDKEVREFVASNFNCQGTIAPAYNEPFLARVAQPMMNAFHCYKGKRIGKAYVWVKEIEDAAWRLAANEWITKRGE